MTNIATAPRLARPMRGTMPNLRPNIRVVKRTRLERLRNALVLLRGVLLAAFVLGLIISLVYSQAMITELTGEVESVRNDLTAAQSNYDYLSSSMDGITSRTNIEQIAEGSLGLVRADASQYTYIRLEDESIISKTNSGAAKLLGNFRTAALSLMGTLDP